MSKAKAKIYRLQRLAQAIQGLFERELGQKHYWVKAEIAEVKKARSGHVYLQLVEEREGIRLANLSAVIWKIDYEQLEAKMATELPSLLEKGKEIVVQVLVDFHPNYGLKLIIKDIDLSFSLGELERRRQENLKHLEQSGKINANRELAESLVWQRVAIISSPEAAALQDFYQHLQENEFNYRFKLELFPSKVQGREAAAELIKALESIKHQDFDCIAIIRGGGSSLDLDVFNDLDLCYKILASPIPVLSGIGHESDWTLVDRVVHSPHKTPTAVADYLIDKMSHFEAHILAQYNGIAKLSTEFMLDHKLDLEQIKAQLVNQPLNFIASLRGRVELQASALIRASASGLLSHRRDLDLFEEFLKSRPLFILNQVLRPRLQNSQERIDLLAHHHFEKRANALKNLAQTIELLSPKQTLKRGYSISRINGKSISSIKGLKIGDHIETEIENGILHSHLLKIEKHEHEN